MTLTAEIIRIVLRYIAAALVTAGVIGEMTGDALANDETLFFQIELVVGMVIAAATEGAFVWSKRKA
jgi:hypothetical protein